MVPDCRRLSDAPGGLPNCHAPPSREDRTVDRDGAPRLLRDRGVEAAIISENQTSLTWTAPAVAVDPATSTRSISGWLRSPMRADATIRRPQRDFDQHGDTAPGLGVFSASAVIQKSGRSPSHKRTAKPPFAADTGFLLRLARGLYGRSSMRPGTAIAL